MAFEYDLPSLELGKVVKQLRELKGYSATSFAQEMEWNKSILSKIENGTRSVGAEELYRMACVLGEPIEKFFPEITSTADEEERPYVSSYVDEIRSLFYELSKIDTNEIPVDIEQEATRIFQREIPATLYQYLNVNPNKVSIKGTLRRGPHFIPRIEIHFLDRDRNKIDWFYIVISFKDKLKHIYASLVQSTDIRYRADCNPVEQAIQLDTMRNYVVGFLDNRYGTEWKGKRKDDIFYDENGFAPEYGTIVSMGYIPIYPPDEYEVWMGNCIEDSIIPFVKENKDNLTLQDGTVPKYVIDFSRENDFDSEEYSEFDSIDEEISTLFDMLKLLIETVENRSFVIWKKDLLTSGMVNVADDVDNSEVNYIRQLTEAYCSSHEIEEEKKVFYEAILMMTHLMSSTNDPEGVLNEIKLHMGWDDFDIEKVVAEKPEVKRGFDSGVIVGRYMSSNPQKLRRVLVEHDYKCEVDAEHMSFMDRSGKPYMELHHLIPLRLQEDFKSDLNVEANMVCVCPLCNRKLAHASESEIEDIIVPLYYAHKDKLKEAGFDISLRQLLQYYQ